jgi:microcystin-dependent protein
MADPFMGEIKMISWNYAPKNWAFCDGALIPVNTNRALFSLLGTTFGGNGSTNFALPDFRGRIPMHTGSANPMGAKDGEEMHTLTANETPSHTHTVQAATASGTPLLKANSWLGSFNNGYGALPSSGATYLNPSTVGAQGSGQGHENRQPFLCIGFVIALAGIFPSRN